MKRDKKKSKFVLEIFHILRGTTPKITWITDIGNNKLLIFVVFSKGTHTIHMREMKGGERGLRQAGGRRDLATGGDGDGDYLQARTTAFLRRPRFHLRPGHVAATITHTRISTRNCANSTLPIIHILPFGCSEEKEKGRRARGGRKLIKYSFKTEDIFKVYTKYNFL